MANQKLENLLELALELSNAQRERSEQLNVGFSQKERTWELIVKYNGNIERVQSDVIKVEKLIAGYAIVTIPESLIESFTQLDEVEYVEKPKRLYFSTFVGKQASCIFQVTERDPFLTGSGILLAVIDSGIDYKSPEFLNPDGTTRIRYLWDQTMTPEEAAPSMLSAPEGFDTGIEFSKAWLDMALQDADAEGIVPGRDPSGHGTAVAAIAAAGGNLEDGRYRGVAPECELIIVKLGTPQPDAFPKTTELMRAVTYVVKKAVELGKPLAINLSFGNTYGSHDGTSLVERFLDNASEIGRTVICVGSGNEGAAGGHADGKLTSGRRGEEKRIELSVGNYQRSFSVQLWKEYTDEVEIILISPGGEQIILQQGAAGGQSFVLEQTEILVYQGEPSPYSVSQEIYFDFLPNETYVERGIWSFLLRPVKIVDGNYDFYLPSSNVLNAGTRFFTPTPDKTLTIPSTAGKVITVGAYDALLEAYADFSGRGYPAGNRRGEYLAPSGIKPDLVAPGVNVQTIGTDGRFVSVSGTSFAAPFVTGSAVLLMEWGDGVIIRLS